MRAMPIVRADVPEWLSHEQRMEIRRELHGCVARTWFREHIWVAVRPLARLQASWMRLGWESPLKINAAR